MVLPSILKKTSIDSGFTVKYIFLFLTFDCPWTSCPETMLPI